MNFDTNGSTEPGKDFQLDIGWVPTTPAKPNLANPRSICENSQENDVFSSNWFESQVFSQGNQENNRNELESGSLHERFPKEFHGQNGDAGSSVDRDFNSWEASAATSSQLYGDNGTIYNDLSMGDLEKWTNVSFGDLLALAQAGAAPTGCTATTSPLDAMMDSQIKGSQTQNVPENSLLPNQELMTSQPTEIWTRSNQVLDLFNYGSSTASRQSFDLNSPPRTVSEIVLREGLQSQFAPITPDQATRAYKEQVSNMPETNYYLETELAIGNVELNDFQKKEQSQLLNVQSCATVSTEQSQLLNVQSCATVSTELQENHAPDKGGSQECELNMTPQQKPRRKKHRPKVVIEGQPKRTPKQRTPKLAAADGTEPGKRKYVRRNVGSTEHDNDGTALATPNGTVPGKRKYVRRNGGSKIPATPTSNGVDRTSEAEPSAAPEGTVPSKRKYGRRNGGSKFPATPTPTENGNNGTASAAMPPDSTETPVGKRKYVRRNGVDNSAITPLEYGLNGTNQMTGEPTRNSCRKSLNFDSESRLRDDNPYELPSNSINEIPTQNFSAQDNLNSNHQLQHAMETRVERTCSVNQVLESYMSTFHGQAPGPSTPLKNYSTHEKSMGGEQHNCTTGQCQMFSSDATQLKMMSAEAQCSTKYPISSTRNNGACFPQETQARGSKRQYVSMTGAEYCSTNVTGNNHNSLQTYLPIFSMDAYYRNGASGMHFPEIYKRMLGGHRSAMCRGQSAVAAAENCVALKTSHNNDVHGQLFAQYDSNGTLTRHASVGCGAQDKKQNFNCPLAVEDGQRLTKRSKGPTQSHPHGQLLTPVGKAIVQIENLDHSQRCMEDLVPQIRAKKATKKQSRRRSSVNSSSSPNLYSQHQSLNMAPPLAITWKTMSPIDDMIVRFSLININAQSSQFGYNGQNALISHQMKYPEQNALISHQMKYPEQNALVVYQRDGSIVPFKEPARRKKPRAKVNLDDETSRVWQLLLENINSEGIDGTDEEKAKWWEEERKVFHGRTDSFIARMHLVQGDRRFSPWKGSVVDSVVGVFLTQNVSDHLSSSAFMSLAALYPLKSENSTTELDEEQTHCIIEEPEVSIADVDDRIAWHEKSNQSTCGQVFSKQQYMEDNREKAAANDSECLQSSSCGTKSTEKLLEHCSQDNHNGFQEPAVDECQTLASSVGDQTELYDIQSSQNSVDSSDAQTGKSELCSLGTSEGETLSETKTKLFSGSDSFVELLQMAGTTILHGGCKEKHGNGSFSIDGSSQSESDVCIAENKDASYDTETFTSHNPGAQEGSRSSDTALCTTENSELSAESANQATFERNGKDRFEEVPKSSSENENTCDNNHTEVKHCTSEDPERSTVDDNPREPKEKPAQSSFNIYFDNLDNTVDTEKASPSKAKGGRARKEPPKAVDWDSLRKEAQANGKKREKTTGTMDSLDWEAIRRADVRDIADAIKARGMNNKLAERIKDFLDRIVREHGSIDLEWLRDVPPDKAKEYLLSIRGLGLKSVECVRLLTLHHLAFPVDTNVGRIAVRLGWVPLQPLPESLQLHLLEMYPVLESIQKYLWPRLCKLDQRTLYELHYQMITFGKVFCTKSKPNCNACPMRGECRHFASAFASARFALPAPEEKTIAIVANQNPVGNGSSSKLCLPQANEQDSVANCSSSTLCLSQANEQNSVVNCSSSTVCLPQAKEQLRAHLQIGSSDPIVEVPASPEPTVEEPPSPEPDHIQVPEPDIEDFEDPDEIPTIKLNMEEFTQNLQMFVGKNMELQEHEMSKALVALSAEAASIPVPKLKNTSRLRTEHHVYELPDSHPLVQGLDRREPDDPSPYLLSIWTPGETAESIEPPERKCSSQECGRLCDEETCFSCSSLREANSQTVRGTLLIPCRTAMRGSFPLNGTYFQVNEVFADHESSINPIDVPRSWIWNLPRRTVYFGTSASSIFRGLNTEEIQYCFWRGFVCVRGFEKETRVPRPLVARFHFPASKMTKTKGRIIENE